MEFGLHVKDRNVIDNKVNFPALYRRKDNGDLFIMEDHYKFARLSSDPKKNSFLTGKFEYSITADSNYERLRDSRIVLKF